MDLKELQCYETDEKGKLRKSQYSSFYMRNKFVALHEAERFFLEAVEKKLSMYKVLKPFDLKMALMILASPIAPIISWQCMKPGLLQALTTTYGIFFIIYTVVRLFVRVNKSLDDSPNIRELTEEFAIYKTLSQGKDEQIQALVEELQEKGK